MKKQIILFIAILTCSLNGANAQKITNDDFSRGKTGWLGDGKVVYIDPSGSISDMETPDSKPAIRIDLSKNQWRGIRQKLHAKSDETELNFSIQVMAGPDYKRGVKSREYSDVDFGEGGHYVWSAKVFPQCDFLIRVTDDTWYYRPLSLSPAETWKTASIDLKKLKARQREIELLVPPGEGVVYLMAK